MVINLFKEPLQDFRIKDLLIYEQMRLNRNDEVMEIGVGSGFTAIGLSKKVKSVTGVDISLQTIERLEKMIEERGYKNVTFLAGDATKLEFGKMFRERFNKIFSCDTLEHIADPLGFFLVIHLLLKVGGEAIIVFPNEDKDHAHGITQFSNLTEIKTLMDRAGFENYEIKNVRLNKFAATLKEIFVNMQVRVFRRFRKKQSVDKPQTFEETWFFQSSYKFYKWAFLINLYWKILIKLISIKQPVFEYADINEDFNISDEEILIKVIK